MFSLMVSYFDTIIIGGGQAGLATAHTARAAGLSALVLEAAEVTAGSLPHYYDSLTLFSPARFSSLPGRPFPGNPDGYPHRDEVIDYLTGYAAWLDADVRTGHRVTSLQTDGDGFEVQTAHGERFHAATVIAATGEFSSPYRPELPGLDAFAGTVLHSAEYRRPEPFAGQRVVIVGGGNSAVQIAIEVAAHARLTLATRHPLRFMPQHLLGRDAHFWLKATGLDTARWAKLLLTGGKGTPVMDTGSYRQAITEGTPDRRPMFRGLDGTTITWEDGTREQVDTILLATGYRPSLDYLNGLGTLDQTGHPRHRGGVSLTHRGLGFVGLEWQRSFSSATLRGVAADARHVLRQLHRQPTRAEHRTHAKASR
jgi:putative flavoprotein involved in K+ transport